jgi:methyltransferase (TIGR00027 family)
MNEIDKISETALIVASLRALSTYEPDDQFNSNDQYAALFLPDDKRGMLTDSKAQEMIRKAIPQGMYEYVISRTKYLDEVFKEAIGNDFGQIVFLGAGFDSRPYRFNDLLNKTRIFEVDSEATQNYKKSLLSKYSVENKNVEYISTDFEEANLFSKIREHGYNPNDRTLFLWEGVTFYLTAKSVIRMLKDIRENSCPGSLVCFDFQTMKSADELIKTGLEAESIKFGIEEGKINEFVLSNQYSIIEHLGSKKIEQKFMMKENGELFGEIAPIMNFILIGH